MSTGQAVEVYITYVEGEGHFLKLWVQLNRGSALFVERIIRQYVEPFEKGLYATHPSTLEIGSHCCARYSDGLYYRARVISLDNLPKGVVNVQFLDYGNKEAVPLSNIKTVVHDPGDNIPSMFGIPEQASCLYLAGVMPHRGEWDAATIQTIRQKLCYEEFQGILVANAGGKKLVSLSSGPVDISQALIQEGLAISIAPGAQHMIAQSLPQSTVITTPSNINPANLSWQPYISPAHPIIQNTAYNQAIQVQTMRAARTSVNLRSPVHQGSARVYGVPVLEVNTEHLVYVSFVDDGPLAFSVQLKACEEQLADLSSQLNSTPQQPMLKPLLPGSVCLGRFSEDHLLCRAVVVSVMDDKCMLYYVDFGNSELLPYSEIYEIPDRYVHLKSMAIRFSLAGIRDLPLNDGIKEEFKRIVLGKLLKLVVVDPEGPRVKQYCDLYINGRSVKDQLLEKLKMQQIVCGGYKKLPLPEIGAVENVFVSYVESASSFYVQLERNTDTLNNIMNYLASYCTRTQVQGFSASELKVGLPCCALFVTDGRWYRGKITSVQPNCVSVYYVDYGNSDSVPITSLCKIDPSLVNQPQEQAIHCLLKGYEQTGCDDKISENFEIITAEKLLSMEVVKRTGVAIIVNLYDGSFNPAKNISDLLTDVQTSAPLPASGSKDDDWKEDTPASTFGEKYSVSNQRDQNANRGDNEGRNAPYRKTQRNDGSVSHWKNKEDGSGDNDRSDYNNRPSSNFDAERGSSKYGAEKGQYRSDNEWETGNNRFGSRGGRQRGEETETSGETQTETLRGGRDGKPRDGKRFREGDRAFSTDSKRPSQRGDADTQYDGNRKSYSGKFHDGDRDFDNQNKRFGDRDRSRQYGDTNNRGGSFGSNARGGSNKREGRFGDHDGDRYGGTRGSNRKYGGTADEVSGSEDTNWNTGRKWEQKSDRNGDRDRWNSRDTGSSNNTFSNAIDVGAPSEEEGEWNADTPSKETFACPNIELNTELITHLIYVENPSEFCLQVADDSKLNELMEQIAKKYKDGGGMPLENVEEGGVCASQYSLDQSWNRAVIQSIHDDKVLVRFVDYGNSDEVPHSSVRTLEKEFQSLPAQAIKCVLLCAKPTAASWSEEEILRFREATDGKQLQTKFVRRNGNVFEVILRNLESPTNSINEEFGANLFDMETAATASNNLSSISDSVEAICASPGDKYQMHKIIIGSKNDIVVSWFINPENFHCQLLSSKDNLKSMMENIQACYRKKHHQKVNIQLGCPVIARFKSDKVLYRAIIKEIKDSGVIVKFVDYGNSDFVDTASILPLEKKYLTYPVFSVNCKLKGVKPPDSKWQVKWSEISKHFSSENITCTFEEQEGEMFAVSLENNGSSVSEALISSGIAVAEEKAPVKSESSVNIEEELDLSLCQGQCLAGHITYVCSLSKFFVHLSPDRATEIQTQIEAHMQQYPESAGKITSESLQPASMCLATPDGAIWYRAIIMETKEQNVVASFIDFGDSAEVPLEMVAPIPANLAACQRLAIQCSLVDTNLDVPNELDEQFKLEVEEQDVILFVDSMIEDRLCVWLFDVEGQRLELLKDLYHENSLQNVEPVCPYPLLSRRLKALVSHVEEEAPFIWLQNSNDAIVLSALLETLFDFYETNDKGKEITEAKPEQLCASKSGNDDNWYRAKIILVTDEKLCVRFIDYGNTEFVPYMNVKALDERFYSPHALSFKVCIPVNVLDNEKTVSELQNLTTEKEFVAQLAKNTATEDVWFVELISEGKNVSNELSELGLVTEMECSPFTRVFMVKPMIEGMKASVYVTHVDSPNSFWVQLGSNLDEVEKLRNMLQKHADASENIKILPQPGIICAAQFSEDASWYRAVVLEVEQNSVTVRFIDYGNTDKITLSSGGLKSLKNDLVSLPAFGVQCSLDIIPPLGETNWSEAAINKFNEIVDETGGVMVAEVLKNTEVKVVTLFTDESNVSSILIDLNMAISPSIKSDTPKKAFVTHINSPSEFWINMEEDSSQLFKLSEALATAESFSPLTNLEDLPLCAAKFLSDEQWYRAKVTSFSDDGVKVFFIDFGNNAIVNEVRSLTEDIANIPPLAVCCTLRKPKNSNNWSETATNKFRELADNGSTLFELEILEDSVPLLISLTVDGSSVENELVSLPSISISNTDDKEKEDYVSESDENVVFVSYCNSPTDFWIQHKTAIEKLNYVSEAMLNASAFELMENAKEGSLCAALFGDDGLWYRARILSHQCDTFSVLFIDYGNMTETDEIRTLPTDLLEIPSIAQQCSLILPEGVDEWPENAASEFLELVAAGQTQFNLRMLNEGTPNVVSLQWNGELVESKLTRPCSQEICAPNKNELLDDKSELDIKSITNVTVSHCTSPNSFWVQKEHINDHLCDISLKLTAAESFESFSNLVEGSICAALFIDDEQWYRAKILNTNEGKVEVLFIDFGNTSITSSIKALPEELAAIPPFAEHCSLHLDNEFISNEKIVSEFHNLLNEGSTVFEMIVLNKENPQHVRLMIGGENVEELLRKKIEDANVCEKLEIYEVQRQKPVENTSTGEEENPEEFLRKTSKDDETTGEIANPEEFPREKFTEANICMGNDNQKVDVIENDADDEEEVGVIRGECIDNITNIEEENSKGLISNTLVEVYGYMEEEDVDLIKPKCTESSTSGRAENLEEFLRKTCGEDSTYKAKEKVALLMNEGVKESICGVAHDVEDLTRKECLEDSKAEEKDGEDLIKQVYIDDNTNEEIENSTTEEYIPVIITHITSPSDFYVQYVSEADAVATITNKMSDVHCFKSLNDRKVGSICAALFEDDGCWYRAQIIACHEELAEVLFIDYGNTSSTNELLLLPDELVSMAPLAKHCCLRHPKGVSNWSEDAESFFLKEYGHSSAICHLVLLESGEPHMVSLRMNGKIIEDQLVEYMRTSKNLETNQLDDRHTETNEIVNLVSFSIEASQNETAKTVTSTITGPDYNNKLSVRDTGNAPINKESNISTVKSADDKNSDVVEKESEQSKTSHEELLIQDLHVEMKIQPPTDQSKLNNQGSQEVYDHNSSTPSDSIVRLPVNDSEVSSALLHEVCNSEDQEQKVSNVEV